GLIDRGSEGVVVLGPGPRFYDFWPRTRAVGVRRAVLGRPLAAVCDPFEVITGRPVDWHRNLRCRVRLAAQQSHCAYIMQTYRAPSIRLTRAGWPAAPLGWPGRRRGSLAAREGRPAAGRRAPGCPARDSRVRRHRRSAPAPAMTRPSPGAA